jgi:hypothetical protein
VNFDIFHLIIIETFTEGNFLCENVQLLVHRSVNCAIKFEAVSLDRVTAHRRVADDAEGDETQFSEMFDKYVYQSMPAGEQTTSPHLRALCVCTSDFEVSGHVGLQSRDWLSNFKNPTRFSLQN